MFTLRSIKENEPCVTLMRMAYGMPGAVNDVVILAMGDDKSREPLGLTQVNPDDFLYVVARLFPEHPVGQMAAKAIETSTVLDDILLPVFNRSQLVALAQAAIAAVSAVVKGAVVIRRPLSGSNEHKNITIGSLTLDDGRSEEGDLIFRLNINGTDDSGLEIMVDVDDVDDVE